MNRIDEIFSYVNKRKKLEEEIKIQEAKNRLKMLQDEDALKERTKTL